MREKIKKIVLALKSRGFFHIIISSSLVKVVSLISALFLPRFLDKTDYGLLTYVDNIRNYILMFNGMGIANSILRYCTNGDDKEKKGYFTASVLVGAAFDAVLIILSALIFLFVPLTFSGASRLLLLMIFLPLFLFLFESVQLFLRSYFENKKYSVLSFSYSAMMVVFQISFAILWGLNGIVAARYIAVLLALALSFYLIRNLKAIKAELILPDKGQIKEMIRFGIVMMAANITSMIMQLNEVYIIGKILKSEKLLADYQVAAYILPISLFLLQSVVVFIFPYFVKHIDDKKWIWQKYKKLFVINAAVMIPIHLLLMLFAKEIVLILFGSKYLEAVPIMRILLVASMGQAVFRGITGNILAGIGEEKFNLRINIIFAIVHVIIDIWAISTFGIKGAAIALTIVYFTSGIVMQLHLRKVCKKAMNSE